MKPLHIATLILGLLLVALIVLYLWPEKPSTPPPVTETEKPQVAPPEPEPKIHHPLPEPEPTEPGEQPLAAKPLPSLDKSDPYMEDLLERLFGESLTRQLLVPQEFIRRTVLIIDSLPGKDLPKQHLPLRSPSGKFQTTGKEGSLVIAPENYRRYTPYVKLAEAAPPEQLAKAYLRIYPLMELAYRELGYPNAYFHDRMIEVLDNLLAAPEVKGPIPVVEHVNRYLYADPQLESLSAGQKILVRMGPENEQRVKAVLQKLRNQLVVSKKQAP
jgi:hypothetical protein